MNLGGLAGLSAAYPAMTKQRQADDQADLSDYKVQDAKRQALAKVAMGNALMMLSQGGQGQGPQPPMPGQPSQPMQQPRPASPPGGAPMAGPQGPGGPPAGGGPPMMPSGGRPAMGPGGPPPQGGMGGQQGGPMDWRMVLAAVKQANPNLPPDVAAEAVNQFLPMMNQQSQMEWKQISLQLREQSLQQRESQFMMAEQGRNQRSETAEGGREARSERTDTRVREGQDEKKREFETREKRLGDALQLRSDTTWTRLEQQKQQAEQKAQAAQGKQGLAEVRAIIDAQDKHVRTRIQAYSSANTLSKKERDDLLSQADKEYNDQIKALRDKFGRTTPTGGTSDKPQPKTDDRVPPGTDNPAADNKPPVEGAKKAPDGKWYVPDPKRPGKYLEVVQ